MIRRVVAEFAAALLGVGLAFVISAQPAVATTAPPCEVWGHLEASPGHVTAVFHVDAVCKEVSLLSWLAPDAHAGQPQTLFSRRSEVGVAPGDYRWTITAPPEGCYFQDDLVLPGGYTIDFILGGDHECTSTTTTTSSTTTTSIPQTSTTTLTSVTTPTSSVATNPTTPPSAVSPSNTASTPTTTEELAFSGGGELWALTLGALGLIGAGRWFEWRGKRRRHE